MCVCVCVCVCLCVILACTYQCQSFVDACHKLNYNKPIIHCPNSAAWLYTMSCF